MRCPMCGNEVSPSEAFCGQCGTPNAPSAQVTEMASAPAPRGGLLRSYNPNAPFAPSRTNTYNSGTVSPDPNVPPVQYPPGGAYQTPMGPSSPHPSTGFHQEPTEAMSTLPQSQPGFPTGYQQPGFPGASMSGGYPGPGTYGPQVQPFQTGNYPGSAYPQTPFGTGQGYEYGMRGRITQPPRKSSNSMLIIVCICVVLALITVIGLGTLYLLKSRSTPRVSQPTAVPTSIATLAPTATPSPTPTSEPTAMPSPTSVPTPTPDTGFQWCNQLCMNNGFSVEYPQTWQPGPASTATVVQFVNPVQQDVYATFKALGAASGSANDLINQDLQANYVSQPGYVAPTSTSTTTISGETWATAVAYYQGKTGQGNTTQKNRVELFAIVHQGKGYIIELQAPDAHFDDVNTQSFENMLGRFQFLQNTTS